jgi:hypothetical protein
VLQYVPEVAVSILDAICCEDQRISTMHHAGLKLVLANLARHVYRLNFADEKKPPSTKKRTANRADAKMLAEGACEAIAAAFISAKAEPRQFAIGGARRDHCRKITVYGVERDGVTPWSKSIEVRRGIYTVKLLDAQLFKAAIKMGWSETEVKGRKR